MGTKSFFHPTVGEIRAACVVMRRKSRIDRAKGNYKPQWHPAPSERLSCCDLIRTPSRKYPFSLQDHCRTAFHIAELFGESEARVQSTIRFLVKAGLEPNKDESLAQMTDRAVLLTPAGAARATVFNRARLARSNDRINGGTHHDGA